MSITSELNRLQQAKSDLAISISNKGVTVPAATTLDGYAALVDQIQQGNVLPYDAEVEYLQSSGTQYINTGLKPNSSWGIRIKYSTDTVSSKVITGNYITRSTISGKTYSDNRNFLRVNGSSKFEIANTAYASALASSATVTENTVYAIDVIIGSSQLSMIVNGTAFNKSYTAVFNPIPIFLYANNTIQDNASRIEAYGHRIYYAQYYNPTNGELLADFIPVRVGYVGYMYDKVSGELFGNAGTGSFTCGPDVT